MEKSLSLSELARCFSGRTFALLVLTVSAYFGYRALTFVPEYRCSLIIQPPQHSEILGPKADWLLREHVALISGQSVSIERRGDLLAVSGKGGTPDRACSGLQKIKEHLHTLNAQVPSRLPALQAESALLDSFFTALLRNGDAIMNRTAYRPDQDKTLPDLLRRKIQVDRMLADPSLLGFKIAHDNQVDSSPRLHFLNGQISLLFGMALLASALIAFLVGYFRLLLKSNGN